MHFFFSFFLSINKKTHINNQQHTYYTNAQRHGARMKCSGCKIIAHASCISILMERSQMACKPTFRDVGVRQYREQTTTHHHWVHRRTEKGKCKQCGKVCVCLLFSVFHFFFFLRKLLNMRLANICAIDVLYEFTITAKNRRVYIIKQNSL